MSTRSERLTRANQRVHYLRKAASRVGGLARAWEMCPAMDDFRAKMREVEQWCLDELEAAEEVRESSKRSPGG